MTRNELLDQIRNGTAANLRSCFPDLAERDLMQLLLSKPAHAVYVLQQSFDCDVEDAKAAWNDYVLRYIDGAGAADLAGTPPTPPQRLS